MPQSWSVQQTLEDKSSDSESIIRSQSPVADPRIHGSRDCLGMVCAVRTSIRQSKQCINAILWSSQIQPHSDGNRLAWQHEYSPATSFPRGKCRLWQLGKMVSPRSSTLEFSQQTGLYEADRWCKRKETYTEEMHIPKNSRFRPYIECSGSSPLSLRRSNRARPFSLYTNNPTSKWISLVKSGAAHPKP